MSRTEIFYRDAAGFRNEPLRWAWALGAVYNVYHGFPVDLPLDHETASRDVPEELDAARTYLPRDWGIEDRASLIASMVRLGRGGHRRPHRALVRRLCALPSQPWAGYEEADRERAANGDAEAHQRLWRMWAVERDILHCRTASLLAFDAARAAQLARNGLALGYLDEAETRGFVFDLAREVSASFATWEAYARDFLLGRTFWAGQPDDGTWEPVLGLLGTRPDSPWRHLPFAFPEDAASRAVTSADARDGPYWTLESAPVRAAAASS